MDEGIAEISNDGVPQEHEELLVQRQVETEGLAYAFANGLIGRWVHQDFNRVADGKNPDENQQGHHQQSRERRNDATQGICKHGAYSG